MSRPENKKRIPGSFRDPAGFLFSRDGILCRQVNTVYKENYDALIESGLYQSLVETELLIPHDEAGLEIAEDDNAYKIINPQWIEFISYPYEWCFSQLKHAALATLKTQKKALEFGMSLKDASAYNIQFQNGKPILIDTLSFEKYQEGSPWVAYRQFCQHFLGPLFLMACTDIRLNQLLRIYIDGIPLDLTAALLPFRTYFKFSALTHIHLHARSQRYFSERTNKPIHQKVSLRSLLGLLDNLERTVHRLKWRTQRTEWADYYASTNYSSGAMSHKQRIIAGFLEEIRPQNVWDLGANTGRFSRIASSMGIRVISFDNDPAAVEANYLESVDKQETHILPLLLDLTNPSSGIGWKNEERKSLQERGPADTVLALAVVHHLAISNNLPLGEIADFFSRICHSLIIEFVPKQDSQVQKLLSSRADIFPGYTQEAFEKEFGKRLEIRHTEKIVDSDRILYLMQRRKTR